MNAHHHSTSRLFWRGAIIEVRYEPHWLGFDDGSAGLPHAHLEIEAVAAARAGKPLRGRLYKSRFCTPEEIERAGGPAGFARAWLTEEARG